MENQEKISFNKLYDKYHKIVLIIPAILLILSLAYLFIFYSKHNDIIFKDISLTGGSSITIYEKISPEKIQQDLSTRLEELETIQLYDIVTREQKVVIIATKTPVEEAKPILEKYLNHELTEDNSSFEFTGASLSAGFYEQLRKAVIVAFLLMSVVVFIVFGEILTIKIYSIILTLFSVNIIFNNFSSLHSLITYLLLPISILSLIFLASKNSKYKWPIFIVFAIIYFVQFFLNISILLILFAIALIGIYLFFSVPSLAVILSAFADMVMTVAIVDLFGMKISSAGIVAFLMLIGYSVDTDIMLTNRLLKRTSGTINHHVWSAFKTGMSMTITALFAVLVSLIITKSLSPILAQIFTVILIGLLFDMINTWITNTSLLKWYVESKERRKNQP
ncbi:MAG: hypothetical protein AABY22_04045 [Nanoarchaeota archaeon]